MNKTTDEYFMKEALKLAQISLDNDITPIGCVIVSNNKIIASNSKTKNELGSATGHCELIAISNAKNDLKTATHPITLYTTLEPCLMCIGSCINAGIDRIVYALPAGKDGGTKYLSQIKNLKVTFPLIESNVLEKESLSLFKTLVNRRKEKNAPKGYPEQVLENYYSKQFNIERMPQTYDEAITFFKNYLNKHIFATLATSKDNITSCSNITYVHDGIDIYFETNINFEKYKNIVANPNVALNFGECYAKGKASVEGKPKDNEWFIRKRLEANSESYYRYSMHEDQRYIKIKLESFKIWQFLNNLEVTTIVDIKTKKIKHDFFDFINNSNEEN